MQNNFQFTKWDGSNNYKSKEKTQEEIDILLENYNLIDPSEYGTIIPGNHVRYFTKQGQFRMGGILRTNGFPRYWALINPVNKISWSVQLDGARIYVRDKEKIEQEKSEKNALWKKIKSKEYSVVSCSVLQKNIENIKKLKKTVEKDQSLIKNYQIKQAQLKDTIHLLEKKIKELEIENKALRK